MLTMPMIAGLVTGVALSTVPPLLPRACEVSIAVSAAPEWLQQEAGVLALTEEGFVEIRSSDNGFTCIVNRDHPAVLKPTCFDKEGTQTIIPKIIFVGEELLSGRSMDAIQADVSARFDDGTLVSPGRPGVAYMLSRYNRPVNVATGELGFFPPHVMFYAPNLTNDDIGHDMTRHDPTRPLPMIAYGGPQGYMLMISDDGKERVRRDLDSSCPDWIWE